MKKFIARSIMILCLFCAAAVPALAGEAPGQAPPVMSQPAAPATAAPAPAAAPAPSAPVTQKALDDLKSSLQVGVDTVWVLLAAFLVFFMFRIIISLDIQCASIIYIPYIVLLKHGRRLVW